MRDTKELRNVLSTQLTKLIDGEIDPPKARAIASMSSQIIASKRLELDVATAGSDQKPEAVSL